MDKLLPLEIESLLEEDLPWYTILSEIASMIYHALPDVSWAGFYLVSGDQLRLGPFQGKPACLRIPYDRGVCGSAWAQEKTLRVEDVESFPGHIACDSASRSEIVVPILSQSGQVLAVLDLDSTTMARFGQEEQTLLESICRILSRHLSEKAAW